MSIGLAWIDNDRLDFGATVAEANVRVDDEGMNVRVSPWNLRGGRWCGFYCSYPSADG